MNGIKTPEKETDFHFRHKIAFDFAELKNETAGPRNSGKNPCHLPESSYLCSAITQFIFAFSPEIKPFSRAFKSVITQNNKTMSRQSVQDLSGLRSLFPEFSSGKCIWVCDEKGNILESGNTGNWPLPPAFFEMLVDQDKLIEAKRTGADKFEVSASSGNKNYGVFSCQLLNFQNRNLMVFRMKEEQAEANWKLGYMAEEFGIYPWRYETETAILSFGQGLAEILGIFGTRLALDDFLSMLSPESLSRFTGSIENTLNFGRPFKTDVLLEGDRFFRWLSISGRAEAGSEKPIISGFIRDISAEKAEKDRLNQLESWVRAGMKRLLVSDAEGNMIADLGNEAGGQILEEGPGRRKVRVVDFRNQVKFIVEAETGSSLVATPVTETTKPVQLAPEEETLPLSREEKFTLLSRNMGLITNSQISAIGLFDGSRFEWKAWWKSPSGYAFPAKKYAGEWLPDLNWLLEMQSENQKFEDRLWWPQDMLPFPIPDVFGQGWMLLTDQLSSGETGLVALRSKSPEELMSQKEEVLNLLKPLMETRQFSFGGQEEIERLKEEIARKEVLLKELNHRAKNNLALAAGMVKMQAGFSEDKSASQFLKQTQKRLETLASLHELMYMDASRDGRIEIQTYLNNLLQGLHTGFGGPQVSMELQLDECEIQNRYAVTIGLLVNEIVSNAYKHAFQDGKTGNLKVDFLSKGEFFKLRVSDNGPGGDGDSGAGNSLGNILIDEFVKQLGASMEISRNPGTTYLISIKKSNIGL
jgi:two-component sensor histidine kinase